MVGWELKLQNISFIFHRTWKQLEPLADSSWDSLLGLLPNLLISSGFRVGMSKSLSGKACCEQWLVIVSYFVGFFSLWLVNLGWLPDAQIPHPHSSSRLGENRTEKLVNWVKNSKITGREHIFDFVEINLLPHKTRVGWWEAKSYKSAARSLLSRGFFMGCSVDICSTGILHGLQANLHHRLGWQAQLCPVVSALEPVVCGMEQPWPSSQRPPCLSPLPAQHRHPIHSFLRRALKCVNLFLGRLSR